MSSIYKDLVESFGYTPVVEAISLDAIMAAVGQEKDEQKRAAALNDIAWKEKLPGLYDPVSGNFVRKQSMPASNRGGRYDIAATASSGDDKTLSGMGLIPNNATTTSPLGKLVAAEICQNTQTKVLLIHAETFELVLITFKLFGVSISSFHFEIN